MQFAEHLLSSHQPGKHEVNEEQRLLHLHTPDSLALVAYLFTLALRSYRVIAIDAESHVSESSVCLQCEARMQLFSGHRKFLWVPSTVKPLNEPVCERQC